VEGFLTPIALYNLKHTSKYYYKNINTKIITNAIIPNIHRRLKQMLNEKYDKFIKYIDKNSVSISGSFILQCILDEHYEGSDVDLYSYLSYNDEMWYSLIDMEDLDETQKTLAEDYAILPDIHDVINGHIKNGQKLQNIQLNNISNYEELKNYIINKYDMDICKNIFTIVNGKSMIYFHNLNKIMNKRDIITDRNIDARRMQRIDKYKSRGFNIKFKYDVFNKLDHIYHENCYYPFLVYKNDSLGKFEMLTFLGLVFNRIDILYKYNINNGDIELCNDIQKYIEDNATIEKIECFKYLFIAKMKSILKHIYEGTTSTHTSYLGKHIIPNLNCRTYNCDVRSKNKTFMMPFVVVNYDDLDHDRKLKYNKVFDTKKCDDDFLKCDYLNDIYL
jgi:hypothetical protein